jgi:L-malate glycosyltransferase
MKIGIVCFPTYGGSGAVAGELAKGLANRGHQIRMISYSLPFRLKKFTKNIIFHEVDTLNYPPFPSPPYVLSLASQIIEICREDTLDVLHLHYAIPHTTSAFLARCVLGATSPVLITTLHGTDITLVGSHPSYYPITKFSIEQSDGITCVSEYLKNTTRNVFHSDGEIKVIYNFVDIEKFRPQSLQELKKSYCRDGEKMLMHISNFRPVKRIEDVIDIFFRINKDVESQLLLIGDGEERKGALQKACDLRIRDRIHFLGKQDNVEDLIPMADLLLLPSADESFGLVALEALSCGVPVIGTDRGGLPEVVTHGLCGFLHPVGDVEAMAASATRALTDEHLMEKLRNEARKRAAEHFDERVIIPRYEAFYEHIIAEKSAKKESAQCPMI